MNQKFETPILFLIFNRPESTRKVFEEIKKIKPTKFFIAADGPRSDKPGEKQLCEETRGIVNNIDWDCDFKLLFRNENLGCGLAVSQAISWFFSQVEFGIILEDDCFPHPDFFSYCEELLIKFNKNQKVMFSGANNFQDGKEYGNASYYFSKHNHIWGWATWKYVWDNYDLQLAGIYTLRMIWKLLITFRLSPLPVIYYLHKFILAKKGKLSTWDYQLTLTLWNINAISIIPNNNLVTNLGIGIESTHTGIESSDLFIPLYPETIKPLVHNDNIKMNFKADRYFFKKYILAQFLKKL